MKGAPRRSVRVADDTILGTALDPKSRAKDGGGSTDEDAEYQQVITEAQRCVGHGRIEGAFPEEWDAQLLIKCEDTSAGHRLVLFCPAFLKTVMDDADELDRAFRFILLNMDNIAMRGKSKYIFVYCCLGNDWGHPALAQRLRFAYDILPRRYAKHLKAFYILHPGPGFRLTMWTFWAWLSKRLWEKIEYIDSMDEICHVLYPDDAVKRAELKRRFPLIVHRKDAEKRGETEPVTFGVPLKQLCGSHGVDFLDRTTGKFYPQLPPAVVFLCEALEREAGDEDFAGLYSADAASVYSLVDAIDQGRPLDRDAPAPALWCALKLFLDCLPSPLLSFQALVELKKRNIRPGDMQGQRKLLMDSFHQSLAQESTYTALYLASFLHTMCATAAERGGAASSAPRTEDPRNNVLTPALAARVFAPGFLRPRSMSEDVHELMPAAISLVQTLIQCAEEPELWIGRRDLPSYLAAQALDSSDDDEEDNEEVR